MTWCNFEPLYKDEPDNYHLLSTCLFIKNKYIKTSYGKVRDVNEERQQQFMKTIAKHADTYEKGYWDKNTRLRIYIDKSLEKHERWINMLKKYGNHPFFQWIKYDIPGKKDPEFQDLHVGLIGTIIRFHPLFVKNDRINCISVVDIDSMYTEKWLNEINEFKKSDKDLHCFSSKFLFPFYGTIIPGISNDIPKGFWIPAGLFSSKIRFPSWRWNRLPEFIESKHIMNKMRYFDAFKMALFDNKIDQFYEDFEYGLDELIINDIVNHYLDKNKFTIMVTNAVNSPQPKFIRDRIMVYLKWNDLKTNRMINLYKMIRVKNLSHLEHVMNKMDNINGIISLFNKKPIIDFLKELQIDRRIIYVIETFKNDDLKNYTPLNKFIYNLN